MSTTILSTGRHAGAAPRRRRWPGALLWLMGLALAVVLVLALTVDALHVAPIDLNIAGEPVISDVHISQLPPAHKVVLAGVILLVLLAATVLLPVAVLVGTLALVLLVLAVIGLPLLLVGLLTMLLLAPLWLLLWALWCIVT